MSYLAELDADVVIVGAGPAGMAAAVRASEADRSVVVIDDNPAAGGQIWRGGGKSSSTKEARRWFERLDAPNVKVLYGSQVIGGHARARQLQVETANSVISLRFEKLILATGARELFLPFPGWTLPGIMGVGGLQALVKSGLPVAGKGVVLAGSGPLLLAVGSYLKKRGAEVKLIAEQAARSNVYRFATGLSRFPSKAGQALSLQFSLVGTPYRFGTWVTRASGQSRLERLELRSGGRVWSESCDYAGIAYGLVANTELAVLLGCELQNAFVVVDDFQRSSVNHVYCAGEITGIGGLDLSIVEGEIAGLAATGREEEARRLISKRRVAGRFSMTLRDAFLLNPRLKDLAEEDTFVCRCEDVPLAKLREHPSFRSAKLHTRCGMGPCQGRICGAACAYLLGWQNESIREPILAARVGSLAAIRDDPS
jgi:D-hydroxyproline dehydrogenase subunit alpha